MNKLLLYSVGNLAFLMTAIILCILTEQLIIGWFVSLGLACSGLHGMEIRKVSKNV